MNPPHNPFEYDPSLFSEKQRREIERQIDGRPRRVKSVAPRHRAFLDQIDQELAVTSRTTLARRAFDAVCFDLMDDFSGTNLAELAQSLRCGPEGEYPCWGFLWLLKCAHERREFALCAAVALRPAFERILNLVDPAGRDEDAAADLLAAFYNSLPITTFDTDKYLVTLQNEVRRSVRRRNEQQRRDSVLAGEVDPDTTDESESPPFDLETVIERVVREFVLTVAETELIVRTQVDSESLRELCIERNVPYKTLQSQRLRAEKTQRGYLSREGWRHERRSDSRIVDPASPPARLVSQ